MAKNLKRALRRPVVFCFIFLLLFLGLAFALLADRGLIFSGVRVEGLDLGGLSLREVQRRLDRMAPRGDEAVVFQGAGRTWESPLSALGLHYLPELAARRAYAVGRRGSWGQRLLQRAVLRLRGQDMGLPLEFDASAARQTLASISSSLPLQPRNATAILEGENVRIVPHQDGISLKVTDTLRAIRRWAEAGRTGPVHMALDVRPARMRSEMLSEVRDVIADFSTSLGGSSRGRRHNIWLAARAIDGTVILPGGRFSYNRAVGPRSPGRGYKTAPVLRRGKLVPGVGGGACQVSSTLYNVALLADMKILRRHRHSRPVRYLSPGRDAAIWFALFDLEFENTSEVPVVLHATVGRRFLRMFALGRALPGPVKITVRTARGEWAKPRVDVDSSLAPGQRVVDLKGAPGIRAIVTRACEGKEEVVSRDYYPPLPAEVRVGPAAAPEEKICPIGAPEVDSSRSFRIE
jgi:vancomycin resistance protein YoaR